MRSLENIKRGQGSGDDNRRKKNLNIDVQGQTAALGTTGIQKSSRLTL